MKINFDNGIVLTKSGKFIDREQERDFFWQKYDELCEITDEWLVTVINYWGMGGIGKSQILKKLLIEAEEKTFECREEIPLVYVSLSEQDTPIKIMNKMVNMLKKFDFIFPLYEAAIFELGRVSGDSEIRKEVKSIEESSVLISSLLEWSAVDSNIAIGGTIFKALDKSAKFVRMYLENKKNDLEKIDKMLPEELENVIPSYFAKDLYWNLTNGKSTYPAIVFLDKVESLRKRITGIDEIDIQISWLKDILITQIPKIVWVCSSREELEWHKNDEWNDSIYNIRVNPFDEKWMMEYFKVNKMDIGDFKQELFELTKGVPLFLEICYELYQKLQVKNETIDFSKFQGKQKRLLETYIENLSDGEMYALFVLSCIGEWDNDFIQFIAQKCKRNDFLDAYNILMKKSYIEETGERIELHQVIKEQIFAFCSDEIVQEIAGITYEFMPKEEFSWFYPKYLRCKIQCIDNALEFDEWWMQSDLKLLKELAINGNINGFESCYRVVLKYKKKQFEDSNMYLFLSIFHIRNLIKLNYFKQAKSESNNIIRFCKSSKKYQNEGFRIFIAEFYELKAQALDGLKKYLQAFNIRKELCAQSINLEENTKASRLHNMATSYHHLKKYKEALEILKEVIVYREKHISDNPEDYIKALTFRVSVFTEYYEYNMDQPKIIESALQYGKQAYDEAHRILKDGSVLRLEVDVIYARLLMNLRVWSEAHFILSKVYTQLLNINQGRNAYIDEIEFMLATTSVEIGNDKEALELFEHLEESAREYSEGSELFSLRCQLEKGISISKGGDHQEAKMYLINAHDNAKKIYGYSEKIVLNLAYAVAVEDYFLENYDDSIEKLKNILPHVIMLFSENSKFVYMIKRHIIRCEEAKCNSLPKTN